VEAYLPDSVIAMALPQRVVLGITLEGRTYDGARLDTGEWYFPVDVCSGCLVFSCLDGQIAQPTNCFGFAQDSIGRCVAAE
jgi:hypothetical protein